MIIFKPEGSCGFFFTSLVDWPRFLCDSCSAKIGFHVHAHKLFISLNNCELQVV